MTIVSPRVAPNETPQQSPLAASVVGLAVHLKYATPDPAEIKRYYMYCTTPKQSVSTSERKEAGKRHLKKSRRKKIISQNLLEAIKVLYTARKE